MYRFGYNGQEKANEIAGVGNHTTAPFWEYDTRLGRRWNLDPVDQISISNYAVNRNNPIWFNDPLGDFSKVGAQWRNFVNDGKGVSYTKSTGEWGYTKGVGGGASYRDGLSKGVRRDRIDNYGKGHAYTRPSAEQQIGKLYEPITKMGESFQNWGDRKRRVSNEEWYGGKSWEGEVQFERHGKPAIMMTANILGLSIGVGEIVGGLKGLQLALTAADVALTADDITGNINTMSGGKGTTFLESQLSTNGQRGLTATKGAFGVRSFILGIKGIREGYHAVDEVKRMEIGVGVFGGTKGAYDAFDNGKRVHDTISENSK